MRRELRERWWGELRREGIGGTRGWEQPLRKKAAGPPGSRGHEGWGGRAGRTPGGQLPKRTGAEPGGGRGERNLRVPEKPRGRGRRPSPGPSTSPGAMKAPDSLARRRGQGRRVRGGVGNGRSSGFRSEMWPLRAAFPMQLLGSSERSPQGGETPPSSPQLRG